jgi:hypothetical protein
MDIKHLNALGVENVEIVARYDREVAVLTPERAFYWDVISRRGTQLYRLNDGPSFEAAPEEELFCAAACLESLYLALRTELKRRNTNLNLTMTHVFADGTKLPSLWQTDLKPTQDHQCSSSLTKFDALLGCSSTDKAVEP